MHNAVRINENLYWIGGNDRRLSLFESAFPVPNGISYNAYLLRDAQNVLFDTVDNAVSEVFFEGLSHLLGEEKLDYLVVHHMEPDHSATLKRVIEKYPEVKLVVNQKTSQMIKNYFGELSVEQILVKEGDMLCTGTHTLRFLFAPMVHWPEVMFTYEEATGALFSADAFGTFGALGGSVFADESCYERDYMSEARRYYANIVGKFGVQVQAALKKTAGLEVNVICPLHGPVWRENIPSYVEKYDLWSRYEAENKGVALFYSSVYGHTQNGAEVLANELCRLGVKEVKVYDVSATDSSYLLSEAFRLSHLVFATTTYNNKIFVSMERFLSELASHGFRNRKYSLVENGSWAPQAGKLMEEEISKMPNMQKLGETVKILSALNGESKEAIYTLAQAIARDVND